MPYADVAFLPALEQAAENIVLVELRPGENSSITLTSSAGSRERLHLRRRQHRS